MVSKRQIKKLIRGSAEEPPQRTAEGRGSKTDTRGSVRAQ